MKFPTLEEQKSSRDLIDSFRGYNHNLRISDNEFYDMKNLTSTHYPLLSPRSKRGVYANASNPQGMIAKDALCYVDNGKFYVNKYPVAGFHLDPNTEKTLVSMGAYVIIMPDKKYINTLDLADFGNIEASYHASEGVTATYELCKGDGTEYPDNIEKSSDAPENPKNMQLWIDESSTPHVLKQYSETSKTWIQIATTYIKISAPHIASAFKQYDAVKITGFPTDSSQLKELEGNTFPLWEVYHDKGVPEGEEMREEGTRDYIVIIGILDNTGSYKSNLCIERLMPAMDFIVESGNRLWGCRYGLTDNGEVVNEIYASKLGDFKNWSCFMGLSTDSYTASVGTDGKFTGAITHLGYPLFFKENYMHKVYGNYPANFQVQTTACRGVQEDSDKSLAIVNEVLYYKSRNAVCAYDGSLPTEISSALGDVSYFDAVAGSHGNKYYISMRDSDNQWTLFVYDASKGMWHKEDDLHAKAFCSCRGYLCYIDDGDTKIRTVLGSETMWEEVFDSSLIDPMFGIEQSGIYTVKRVTYNEGSEDTMELTFTNGEHILVNWSSAAQPFAVGDLVLVEENRGQQTFSVLLKGEDSVEWMAETGSFGIYTPDKKYVSRLSVRMSLALGTRVYFYAQYDSSGEWEHLFTMTGTSLRSFAVPIRPRRCDHMKLRIVGEGDAKIYSIAKTIEQGSDI